jgi:hypothetical protein
MAEATGKILLPLVRAEYQHTTKEVREKRTFVEFNVLYYQLFMGILTVVKHFDEKAFDCLTWAFGLPYETRI